MTVILDEDRLAEAMWTALSDRGVMRIDADSPKELHDVARAVAAEYNRLTHGAVRYRLYGGSMVEDPEGQWRHVNDDGIDDARLDPAIPKRKERMR